MKTIKVALAGGGAFGIRHLDGIGHVTTELADCLVFPCYQVLHQLEQQLA